MTSRHGSRHYREINAELGTRTDLLTICDYGRLAVTLSAAAVISTAHLFSVAICDMSVVPEIWNLNVDCGLLSCLSLVCF